MCYSVHIQVEEDICLALMKHNKTERKKSLIYI